MKLVFLHIEKSAGTSQREMLKVALGDKNVAWFEIDWSEEVFDLGQFEDALIIGGHRRYNFYLSQDLVYLAVVREPYSRVLSLYNYYREHQLSYWKEHGLDEEDINITLKRCQLFRNVIDNAQCEYISGSKSFDDTKSHILANKYLVADFSHIDDFNTTLSLNLGIKFCEPSRSNVGTKGYQDNISINKESEEILTTLLAEDIKLYNFISEKSVVDTTSESDWQELRLKVSNLQK